MSRNKLPNFLIVGSTKSGTTSIYNYLKKHPDVFLNKDVKETNFFIEPKSVLGNGPRFNGDDSYGKNIELYEKLFNDVDLKKHKAIGEICTTYLHFSEYTIPNIKKYLTDPKIIIILRNPVDRAYSHYMHNVRDGDERLSFEDALKAETERRQKGMWLSYYLKELGEYYNHIENYLQNFKCVKVLFYEDMEKDPVMFLNSIMDFLAIKKINLDIDCIYNVSGMPRSRTIHNMIHGHNALSRSFLKMLCYLIGKDKIAFLQSKVDYLNLIKKNIQGDTRLLLNAYYYDEVLNISKLLNVNLFEKWGINK